jgi:DNA-binding NarL/FixJ family response regulator/class 3 adenylate cyclase
MSDLPTGIVTLLCSDLHDSPEVAGLSPEGYGEVIADHRRLVRAAIAERDGREVDCRGDEFLVVFGRTRDAVLAAAAIQRAHHSHTWADGATVLVRIAVHTGEPMVAEGSYVGFDVHRVARLCAAGHGGQILLSQSAQTLLQDDELAADLVDLGEVELAGLPRPERVFQLVLDDLPAAFPALRTGSEPRVEGGERTAGPAPGALRVVLAEDAVLLREGIALVLEKAGFAVVGQVGDPDDLLLKVRSYEPDVAVIDVRMPPTHSDEGLRAAQTIRERHPGVGVLVLSQYVEPAYVVELLAENAAGVGYLLKDRVNDVTEFVSAVRRVAAGGTAFDPEVVSRLVGRRQQDGVLDGLTPREREVLALMAEGRSNQAISERLYLSSRAIERHVTSIFEKLQLPVSGDDNRRVLAVLAFLRD